MGFSGRKGDDVGDDASKAFTDMMLAAIGNQRRRTQSDSIPPKSGQARALADILPDILRPCRFEVGQHVEQIQKFSRYRFPEDGRVAIVSAVLTPEQKAAEWGESDDQTFARNDMAILVLAEGAWVEFLVESWRFQLYDGVVD